MQRRIVRNLFGRFFENESFDEILRQTEMLKLVDIYTFRVGCLMFKMIIYNESTFHILLNYIDPHVADHNFNTRNVDRFILPFPIVENVRLKFKYQFLNILWNDIPHNMHKRNAVV
jgi:hypothetical protein